MLISSSCLFQYGVGFRQCGYNSNMVSGRVLSFGPTNYDYLQTVPTPEWVSEWVTKSPCKKLVSTLRVAASLKKSLYQNSYNSS